jgi:hypothetical protein
MDVVRVASFDDYCTDLDEHPGEFASCSGRTCGGP